MSIVMKFGGTSVADANAFENVSRIVSAQSAQSPIVVVSAMGGVTDALLRSFQFACDDQVDQAIESLAESYERYKNAAVSTLEPRESAAFCHEVDDAAQLIKEHLQHGQRHPYLRRVVHDEVLSFGERLSSNLLTRILRRGGVLAENIDARRCIVTNDEHGSAAPLMEPTLLKTSEVIGPLLEDGLIPVLGGFIGATVSGSTTTLGRGGSDYTASILGAAAGVNEIQIWTDVTGVLTADPRVVPQAQTVERLSYSEAAELAYFGAKVLHPKTIQPAIELSIPVRICNSRQPDEAGTLVCAQVEASARAVKAIAHKCGVTTVQITSARMLGAYGFLRALFEVFERHRTVVDVVTTSEVSVSLSLDDATRLPAIVEELRELGTVRVEGGRAIICVVGEGLQGTPGIAASVFNTISDINVTLISQGASSINLTFAVDEQLAQEAVRRLHAAFFDPLVRGAESEVERPEVLAEG